MTTLNRLIVSCVTMALAAAVPAAAQLERSTFSQGQEPIVKGAPYSGEGITTVKLTMFDGTKIERTVTARLYRDSAGRIRREQTVVGLETLDPGNDFRAVVHIVDPVAGVMYTLNPGSRTAYMLPLDQLTPPAGASVKEVGQQRRESLGTKDIDGLKATGQRMTTTIPAGQIGNDRPIEIVEERWESVDLKVLLRSLYRDPRSGDVEYALTKISRTEPPATMFKVPAGYDVRKIESSRSSHPLG